MRRLGYILLLLLAPQAAQAKWLEASSPHFVVYGDDNPNNIRRFSEQLERFHIAMTKLLEIDNPVPSPSNRVTVYMVRTDSQVRKLAGETSRFTYGFYIPRAGGSLAIVPEVQAAGRGDLDFSMIALLHEYAHHVTLSSGDAAMPVWMMEGVAEFFASAKFYEDGTMDLGLPALHRGPELFLADSVPMTELLAPDMAKRMKQKTYDSFYGRSWLLYHYLSLDKTRAGQLNAYLLQVNAGKSSLEAGQAVFGDLRKLDKELDQYMRGKRMMMVKMAPAPLPPNAVTVRELPPGEAAIMSVRIRSDSGVTRQQALALLPEARKVAAAYPADAAVLTALAEAEHDAGNDTEAIAAADAAIAIDPKQANAYVQKGYSLFRRARALKDPSEKAAAYVAARKPFLALNAIENDHPLPLIHYYLSFTEQGRPPGETGVAALRRAVDLAPFDLGLRMMLAVQDLRDGRMKEAIANLRPIAYNPHGGQMAEQVKLLLARIEAGATKDDLFKNGKLDIEQDEDAPESAQQGN